MPSTTTTPPARTRQRPSHYPAQYSVCLSQEVADPIESFCDTYEVAPGTLLRRIVGRGLEPTKVVLAPGRGFRQGEAPRRAGSPDDGCGAQGSRLDIRVRPGRPDQRTER